MTFFRALPYLIVLALNSCGPDDDDLELGPRVAIYTSKGPMGRWIGSGVPVEGGSIILTVPHVLAHDDDGDFVLQQQGYSRVHEGEQIGPDRLRVDPPFGTYYEIRDEVLEVGDVVYLCGAVSECTEGVVSGHERVKGWVSAGDSGGAVVDQEGRLAGIVDRGFCLDNERRSCSGLGQAPNYEFVGVVK